MIIDDLLGFEIQELAAKLQREIKKTGEKQAVFTVTEKGFLLEWSTVENAAVSSANVRGHLLPPAFGADPASAGSVTKVPKAW